MLRGLPVAVTYVRTQPALSLAHVDLGIHFNPIEGLALVSTVQKQTIQCSMTLRNKAFGNRGNKRKSWHPEISPSPTMISTRDLKERF